MATVLPNLKVSVSLEQKQPSVDEEVGIESKVSIEKTSWGLPLFACIVIFSLTVCLSIGLRRNDANKNAQETATGATDKEGANPNLKIYDDALALLESTPLQYKQVPSGEILTYREYNIGQPHVLVVLPGFRADDTMISILAVLPELQDQRENKIF